MTSQEGLRKCGVAAHLPEDFERFRDAQDPRRAMGQTGASPTRGDAEVPRGPLGINPWARMLARNSVLVPWQTHAIPVMRCCGSSE